MRISKSFLDKLGSCTFTLGTPFRGTHGLLCRAAEDPAATFCSTNADVRYLAGQDIPFLGAFSKYNGTRSLTLEFPIRYEEDWPCANSTFFKKHLFYVSHRRADPTRINCIVTYQTRSNPYLRNLNANLDSMDLSKYYVVYANRARNVQNFFGFITDDTVPVQSAFVLARPQNCGVEIINATILPLKLVINRY
ncbi:MAG: hypothetical protein R2880_01625 [Deinococcales bacterium]